MKPHAAFRISAFLFIWSAFAISVPAQSTRQELRTAGEFQAPGWAGDIAFLGIDALLGGLTAGLFQELRGGSFQDGFTRGALGGAVSYSGRRLSVEPFYGAGLLGREISAVGASVVRNASEGHPTLERLFLPIGPVHVYVNRSPATAVQAKLNLYAFSWTVAAALRPELRFDLSKSISAGAPVFVAPHRSIISAGDTVSGMVVGGTIFLSRIGHPLEAQTFAHERVHVLQSDFLFHTWGEPFEGWAARSTRVGSSLYRYLDIGVTMPFATAGLYTVLGVERRNRLRELEADFLARR